MPPLYYCPIFTKTNLFFKTMDHIIWQSFCFCLDVQTVKGIIHNTYISITSLLNHSNSCLNSHLMVKVNCWKWVIRLIVFWWFTFLRQRNVAYYWSVYLLMCTMTSFKVFLGLSCFSMLVSSVKAAVQVLEENWERGFQLSLVWHSGIAIGSIVSFYELIIFCKFE